MMRAMKWLRSLAVFVCSGAWLSLMISWTGFSDPDAFYHAHASLLLWQHGPLLSFPWLDLTLLGTSFADLHFLFHVFVAPFVAVFGEFQGLRIATVVLCALFLTIFEACLRWLEVHWSVVWTTLLILMYAFVFRILLGKATPLALIWYVLGLSAAWKRKPWLVCLAAFGYALSHGGWIYLIGSIPLLIVGDVIFSRFVEELSWRTALQRTMWRECLAAVGGVVLALLVHPNRAQIFVFLWTQVVTIGLLTPFKHVVLGTEWLPPDLGLFVDSMLPLLVLVGGGLVAFILAPRRPLELARARLVTAFGLIVAVHVALTLKTRRDIEFLIPVLVIWCGMIWSLVDLRRLWNEFRRSRSWFLRTGPLIVGGAFCVLMSYQIYQERIEFHPSTYPDAIYRTSMHAISERAQPGDRVFHSSWDEFPMLFAADDRLKYISGMDPTFLYVASSTLSDQYRDLTWGVTTSTDAQAWSLIHDQLNAKFVFVSKPLHKKLLDLLKADTRFVQLEDTTDSAAFEVK